MRRDIKRCHRAVVGPRQGQGEFGGAARIGSAGNRHENVQGAAGAGAAMRAARLGDREGPFELAGDTRDLVVERAVLRHRLDADEQEVIALAGLPGDRLLGPVAALRPRRDVDRRGGCVGIGGVGLGGFRGRLGEGFRFFAKGLRAGLEAMDRSLEPIRRALRVQRRVMGRAPRRPGTGPPSETGPNRVPRWSGYKSGIRARLPRPSFYLY